MIFNDNNFYGNSRDNFRARIALIRERYEAGQFGGWGALVTSDFFTHDENLQLVREAGCKVLFCGVESFDPKSIDNFDKSQNKIIDSVELIRKSLEAGILLIYGLIADVTTRSLESIEEELDFVVSRPEITLPSFVSLPIPFPGTPFFAEAARNKILLPNTYLRDLNGSTLALRPLDPIDKVAGFVHDLQNFRGRRLKVLRHGAKFLSHYRKALDWRQLGATTLRDLALVGAPALVKSGRSPWAGIIFKSRRPRTHISSTEALDASYQPTLPVDAKYRGHFEPTAITNERGDLVEDLATEMLGSFAPTGVGKRRAN